MERCKRRVPGGGKGHGRVSSISPSIWPPVSQAPPGTGQPARLHLYALAHRIDPLLFAYLKLSRCCCAGQAILPIPKDDLFRMKVVARVPSSSVPCCPRLSRHPHSLAEHQKNFPCNVGTDSAMDPVSGVTQYLLGKVDQRVADSPRRDAVSSQ